MGGGGCGGADIVVVFDIQEAEESLIFCHEGTKALRVEIKFLCS